ncbi:hypothetical protein ACOHYD_00215 [Desulfobacterota bacterium M19]
MLCPKCSYISFDSLDFCPSCKQDLTETRKTLNGTAIMVEEQYFLGSICQDDEITQQPAPRNEYEDESREESMPESDESTSLNETADEQDEISFDLGEMPPLDQSSLDLSPDLNDEDRQEAEEAAALMTDTPDETEINPEAEAGITLTESADLLEEEKELPPEGESNIKSDVAPIILESPLHETKDEDRDNDQLTLDIDSLSLEIDDDPLEEPAGQPATDADDSESLSLDLEQIDLSDLVHDPQPAASSRENTTIPQVEKSLDTGDINIDEQELTLESLETEPEALELELDFDQDNQEFENASLEPIDLSLDIEPAPEELDLSPDETVTAKEKR